MLITKVDNLMMVIRKYQGIISLHNSLMNDILIMCETFKSIDSEYIKKRLLETLEEQVKTNKELAPYMEKIK